MINIAYIINNFKKNGAETMLSNFVEKLKINHQDNFYIHLILLNDENDSQNLSRINNVNVSVTILNSKKLFSAFTLINLYFTLKKIKVDIIHVHLFPSFYYIGILKIFKLISCKTILTEHTTHNNRFRYRVFRYLDKFIYGSFDLVICVSQSVQDYLSKNVLCNYTKVVNNGIDHFPISNEIIKYFNAEFSLNSDVFKILMVARFEQGKDHITLIKSLTYLSDLNFRLFLVGKGVLENQVKNLISFYGLENKVVFLGLRNDVRSLMSYVDLNILSSEFEGFSGVALESVFAMKPFIGTYVPGIIDVIKDDSLLFKTGDFQELARLIRLVYMDSSVSQTNVNLNSSVIEKYTLDNMVNQHVVIYKAILSKSS